MIAYAMLYAAVAAVPVLLAAVLEAAFLRTHGRAERWVWTAALLIALALPLAVLTPPDVPLPASEAAVISEVASELQPVLVLPAAPATTGSDFDPSAIVMALWLAASAALVARWSLSGLELRRRRRNWSAQRLDGVPVSFSADVGPGVFGLWRPQIVIPSWVVALPAEQRAFVLRHEQEHLRGRDHWLSALIRASRVLAPWNPVVWLLSSKLGRAMELDCDRRVLRADGNVAGYGATLLLVSEYRAGGVVPAVAFAASELPLRERILAMTAPQRSLSAMGLGAALVVGVVLLATALRVPVPAVGTPTLRLERVVVAAPEGPIEALEVAASVPSSERQASAHPQAPERLGVLLERLRLSQQAAQAVLPELRVLLQSEEAVTVRAMVAGSPGPIMYVGPRSEWVVMDTTGSVGLRGSGRPAQVIIDSAGTIVEIRPSPLLREITEAPRIANPEEVLAAMSAEYPLTLRGRGLGGTVAVRFHVGEAGEVREIRLGQRSAYPALDEAALRVARVYRFSPARNGDEYVTLWVSHAIDFRVP